jgi:hypothetical protein
MLCSIDSSTKLLLEIRRSFALLYTCRRCFTKPIEKGFDDAVDPVQEARGVIGFRFFQMDQTVPKIVATAPESSIT